MKADSTKIVRDFSLSPFIFSHSPSIGRSWHFGWHRTIQFAETIVTFWQLMKAFLFDVDMCSSWNSYLSIETR